MNSRVNRDDVVVYLYRVHNIAISKSNRRKWLRCALHMAHEGNIARKTGATAPRSQHDRRIFFAIAVNVTKCDRLVQKNAHAISLFDRHHPNTKRKQQLAVAQSNRFKGVGTQTLLAIVDRVLAA